MPKLAGASEANVAAYFVAACLGCHDHLARRLQALETQLGRIDELDRHAVRKRHRHDDAIAFDVGRLGGGCGGGGTRGRLLSLRRAAAAREHERERNDPDSHAPTT